MRCRCRQQCRSHGVAAQVRVTHGDQLAGLPGDLSSQLGDVKWNIACLVPSGSDRTRTSRWICVRRRSPSGKVAAICGRVVIPQLHRPAA